MKFKALLLAILSTFILLATGCAPKVLVGPRMDLKQYGRIGVIEIDCASKQSIGRMATREMMEAISVSQPGVPIVELGWLSPSSITFETIRKMKKEYNVDAIITGELMVSKVKPKLNANILTNSLNVRADLEGVLQLKMYETQGGAVIWTRSESGTENVARAGVNSGNAYLGTTDSDQAQINLISDIVQRITHDFKSHWR